MGQLAIVITVDTVMAYQNDSLDGQIYLIDNNKHAGSTGQGTADLVTFIEGCQVLNWLPWQMSFTSGDPGLELIGIKGEAVDKKVMVPMQFESPVRGNSRGLWWGATVDSTQEQARYSYILEFQVGDKVMEFTSTIDVREAFSNVRVQ